MRSGVLPLLAACCGYPCCVAVVPSQPDNMLCQPPETSDNVDDRIIMLQMSLRPKQRDSLGSSRLWGRAAARLSHRGTFVVTDTLTAATSEASAHKSVDTFDCQEYPDLCEAPFHCDLWSSSSRASVFFDVATRGRSNLQSWCEMPQYDAYIKTCLVDHDLSKAAWVLYNETAAGNISDAPGDVGLNFDASYCFLAGHCTNTAVTNDTTLEEAELMCDRRYGHTNWTTFLQPDSDYDKLLTHVVVDASHGGSFTDPASSTFFVKLACAMGNFHCDVMYCKETYCTMPEYIEQFAQLQPEIPGHLIQEK